MQVDLLHKGRRASVYRVQLIVSKVYAREYEGTFLGEYNILTHLSVERDTKDGVRENNQENAPQDTRVVQMLKSSSTRILRIDMPWYGESLESALGKRAATAAECRQWRKDLLEGLAFLHERRVMHRNVHPTNILVTGENRLVFCDFSSASVLAKPASTLEEPPLMGEEQPGGLAFRAPEILLGATLYAYEVDVWALGCVLAMVLGGCNPMQLSASELSVLECSEKKCGSGRLKRHHALVHRTATATRQLRRIWDVLEGRLSCTDEYRGLPNWGRMRLVLEGSPREALRSEADPHGEAARASMWRLSLRETCMDTGILQVVDRCWDLPSERPRASDLCRGPAW